MKNKRKICLPVALVSLLAFALWTALLHCADVAQIGPMETSVGLSTLNGQVHGLIGVNMTLYNVTDWLGLVPITVALGFALLGAIQWIKRKSLARVDRSLLILGGFYTVVIAFYALFEKVVVNYRPVLINNCLEASYPSSTAMLVMCVMPTAAMQFDARIKNKTFRYFVSLALFAFAVFTVIGRILSGVHWITDIIGGILLSTGLVMLYAFFEFTPRDE